MANETYTGTSHRGDFQEAIAEAIQEAKIKLRTDFVRWKLDDVGGENGGFVLKNELTVSIFATGPNNDFEGKKFGDRD